MTWRDSRRVGWFRERAILSRKWGNHWLAVVSDGSVSALRVRNEAILGGLGSFGRMCGGVWAQTWYGVGQ